MLFSDRNSVLFALYFVVFIGQTGNCQPISHNAQNSTSDLADIVVSKRDEIIRNAVEELHRLNEENPSKVLGEKDGYADRRYTLIRVLSAFRAPEGISELLAMIDLKTHSSFPALRGSERTISAYYPAAGALIQIGSPAVESVIHQLKRNPSDVRRENLCWVIGKIEGGKYALMRIEDAIAELESLRPKVLAERRGTGDLDIQITQLREAIPVLEKLFPQKQR